MSINDKEIISKVCNDIQNINKKDLDKAIRDVDIQEATAWLASLDVHSEYEATMKELILSYIENLETENRQLKQVKNHGLDKEKQYCFYPDGNSDKCLGYSYEEQDEPCDYCKGCERLSIKEDD